MYVSESKVLIYFSCLIKVQCRAREIHEHCLKVQVFYNPILQSHQVCSLIEDRQRSCFARGQNGQTTWEKSVEGIEKDGV